MSTSASWGEFEWGEAEWGSAELGGIAPNTGALTLTGLVPGLLPAMIQPATGVLALAGIAPSLGASATIVPLVGQLILIGGAPPVLRQPTGGALTLTGYAPEIERSDENRLGFQWAVLTPADLPLGFRWTVLPVVLAGGELGLTWVVVAEAPTLGFTWHVVPPSIFELFESEGIGAAAGIGEDVLLPVGRVTRE
jgi:hypothetical protein